MADTSSETMIAGLSRALTDPSVDLLHGHREQIGLFPSNASGRKAAQQCKDAGFLKVVRTEKRGRSTLEHCVLTKEGARHLLTHTESHQILEDFVRAVELRESQLDTLLEHTQQLQAEMRQLSQSACAYLHHLNGGNSSSDLQETLLQMLQQRQQRATGDCPLPELFANLREKDAQLTIGKFHDALRQLTQQEVIYLHPWTGPLYEMPDPRCALLIGHEIAYYASIRMEGVSR